MRFGIDYEKPPVLIVTDKQTGKKYRIIDSLEQIQQHTHEIANISIDRAEAADARSSTPDSSSKAKHSIFGKKLGNQRR